jgi:LIM domain/Protein DA1
MLICKGCAGPITSSYVEGLGSVWHPEHFTCVGCGSPIAAGGYYTHGGQPYHAACYASSIVPRCGCCGKPLLGAYLLDYWGVRYCTEHQDKAPQCRYCGRLLPQSTQTDSRAPTYATSTRCAVCHAAAVDVLAQAQPLFARCVRWINNEGLRFNNLDLRIELRNQTQLAAFLGRPGESRILGATLHDIHTRGGQVVATNVKGVAILRGLPSPLFEGVTVHELGHAWLAVHIVTELPSWAEEGFCELIAHRLYSRMATKESQFYLESIEKNPDPIYGAGFSRMHSIAQQMGFPQLLDMLRSRKGLS